ncbi:unnamed protein product [Spirodela intermedia]|uniref:Protein kinase domain-containing protein n=1 Tax=Spirodela intermedia TaxID=51605 RepID=A0A7I8IZR1_SPIIN|nr:unnamed protein product [Spirodela intermedia]CAA6662540.1 unnamed protein product [Spirodela intermedia]
MGWPYHVLLRVLFVFLLACHPSLGQPWDGVVITQADYQGLQAFKRGLVDRRGFLRSWNDSGVISIQLPWRGLGGRISDGIAQLTALRKLNLHDNFIGGAVPSAIGFLPNLRGLYLFNNRLSGTIPRSIASCPLLQTLDLSNNYLRGPIPADIAASTKLYRLNLSHNNLSGGVPIGLAQSPSLTFLSLHHNLLSGNIPDGWGGSSASGSAAHRLQILNLDHNFFTGDLPASLGRLQSLQVVTISNNRINGSIPEDLGNLPVLQRLDISENSIGGGFPASLCNLTSLIELNLEGNLLGDLIPDAIDGLKNLSFLSLKGNRFQGPIPATIGNISGLSRLDLSENNFTGVIPGTLARLTNLSLFNVSDNNLSGRGNLQLCGYKGSPPCPLTPPPSLPPTTMTTPEAPRSGDGHRLSTKDIILIVIGAVLFLLLVLCCVLLICLIRKRTDQSRKSAAAGAASRGRRRRHTGGKLVHFDGPLVFTADDLLCATAEIMGKSTYGTVYKATLEDGNQVAVKRLREKIAKNQKEFEAEVNVLGKIRHSNLLALRAYYLGPKGEKLLVFDYMPKGSLAAFLHARGPDTPIDWPTRMKIVMGATRGLHHLHTHENMVHGNLTSGNILLDEQVNAKIADYGLSRLMSAAANSNVIATAGALGYRAPELSKLKKASVKTDVYSLGVVMLELLTGKSPGEAMNGVDLPQWVASIVKEEWTNEVFDLELMRDAEGTTGDELLNTLKLALHCVDPSAAARPEAQQILQQLEEIKPELAGTSPAAPSSAANGGGDDDEKNPAGGGQHPRRQTTTRNHRSAIEASYSI